MCVKNFNNGVNFTNYKNFDHKESKIGTRKVSITRLEAVWLSGRIGSEELNSSKS